MVTIQRNLLGVPADVVGLALEGVVKVLDGASEQAQVLRHTAAHVAGLAQVRVQRQRRLKVL